MASTADKYTWLADSSGEDIVTFMDYETFGEHQKEYTGIFDSLKALPEALSAKVTFVSESFRSSAFHQPVAPSRTIPYFWADGRGYQCPAW